MTEWLRRGRLLTGALVLLGTLNIAWCCVKIGYLAGRRHGMDVGYDLVLRTSEITVAHCLGEITFIQAKDSNSVVYGVALDSLLNGGPWYAK